ncbi:type II toxin-antitoxin system MqsA family antitoxin [Spirosoma sp. SC4-14]|uniref:type II toxin-antitoxin system MqsA family antitoxin n=1 Tax=Spirosoma sp. SC4-14 TaxID=3128900 RepID=UPI0030D0E8B7
MTQPDKCRLCGGMKASGHTTFSVDPGDGPVVAHHVPATICNQCGKEWIETQTAQQLETIVEEARQKKHQLEVLSL